MVEALTGHGAAGENYLVIRNADRSWSLHGRQPAVMTADYLQPACGAAAALLAKNCNTRPAPDPNANIDTSIQLGRYARILHSAPNQYEFVTIRVRGKPQTVRFARPLTTRINAC